MIRTLGVLGSIAVVGLASFAFAQEEFDRAYVVVLQYVERNTTVLQINEQDVNVEAGVPDAYGIASDGQYRARLVDRADTVLHEVRIDPPRTHVGESFGEDGEISATIQEEITTSSSFTMPFFASGNEIQITQADTGIPMLAIDVSRFGFNCGDGICQALENHAMCAADCEELDLSIFSTEAQARTASPYLMPGVIGLLLVIAIGGGLLALRSKQKR